MLERCGLRKWLKCLPLAVLIVVLAIPSACSAPLPRPASDGAVIFQKACSGCHTIGAGDLVGPDLRGVTQRRDQQWLAEFIAGPDKVLASSDPTASTLRQQFGNVDMPNLGLSQEQVAAVIAYLDNPTTQPTSIVMSTGDSVRGQALFMGNLHFQNGGPPCMGCHNIGSNGLLGGGTLGPDLTGASTRYNDASLAAALASLPWPTMKPIFSDQPLTPQEQADLRLFIHSASSQKQTNQEVLVMAISLAGFIAAVVFFVFLYRHRLRGVRRPLVERARAGK